MAKKQNKLTTKDRHLIKLVISNNYNESETARQLGVTPQTVNERMKKIRNKISFQQMMEEMGITSELLTQKITEGLNSNKIISANIVRTKSNDPTVEDELAHTDTKDFIEVEDMPTRHKYLQTALQVLGHVQDKGGTNVSVLNINYGHRAGPRDSAVRDEGRSGASSESDTAESTRLG